MRYLFYIVCVVVGGFLLWRMGGALANEDSRLNARDAVFAENCVKKNGIPKLIGDWRKNECILDLK